MIKRSKLWLLLSIVIIALLIVVVSPTFGAFSYTDVTGNYTITDISATYLSGTKHPTIPLGILNIATQSGKTISSATLTTFGKTISLTGLVGSGSKPYVSLTGTDSDGTYVIIDAKVRKSWLSGTLTGLSGRIEGWTTSDGYRWDSSATGTGAATISTADYYSEAYSTLLTGGNETEAVVLQFNHPKTTFRLKELDTLTDTGSKRISFWFLLANATQYGPQIGLRFAPVGTADTDLFSSVSHVDITLAPYYSLTGNGTWQQCTITKNTTRWFYYGNDPVNQTAISGSNVTGQLWQVEAAINADAEMVAHGSSASNWVLTAVYIDLYESGSRTCYIDDVRIGGSTYTLEPYKFGAAFTAKVS